MGAQSGPPTHEVATADLVGWNTVMHLKPPGHPKGGSGMLSVALQRFAPDTPINLLLAGLVLAINLLGDALRDALDPKIDRQ